MKLALYILLIVILSMLYVSSASATTTCAFINITQGPQGIQGIQGIPGLNNMTMNLTANMTMNMTPNMTANMTMNMTSIDTSGFYFINTSRALTGEKIQRDVDNDLLSIYGGNAIAGGLGGILSLFGKDTVNPNAVEVVVGDGGVGNTLVTSWKAGSNPSMSMNGWNITGIMRIANATDAVNLSFVQGMNQSLLTNLSTTIASANQSLFTNLSTTIASANQSLFTNLSSTFTTTAYVDAVNASMRNNVSQYVISVNNSMRSNVSQYVIAVNNSMRANVSTFVISANQSLFTNLTATIASANQSLFTNLSTTIASANQSLFTNLSSTFTTTTYVDAVNNSMRNNVSQYVISVNDSMRNNVSQYVISANQSLFTNLTATIVSANQSLFTNLTSYIDSKTESGWNTSYLLQTSATDYLFLNGSRAMTGTLNLTGTRNVSGVISYVDGDAVNGTYLISQINSTPEQAIINESYAYLPGRSGGQTLTGGTGDNENLVLNGTSSLVKTTSYVNIQPDGGKVGIGTSAPTYALQVVGDQVAPTGLYVGLAGLTNSTGSALYVYRNRANSLTNAPVVNIIQDYSSDDQVLFRLQQDGSADIVNIFDGSTEVFTILNGGNVGIGTTAPSQKLDVIGQVNVSGNISGVFNPVANQDAATKAYVDSANQSLFTNLTDTIVSANQSLFTNLSSTFATNAYVDAVNNSMRNNVSQYVIAVNQSLFTNLSTTIASANQSLFTNLTATIVSANQSLFTNLSTTIASANQSLFTNLSSTIVSTNQSLFTNLTNYVNSKTDSGWNTSYLLKTSATDYLFLNGSRPMVGNLSMNGLAISNIKNITEPSDATNLSFVQVMNQSLFTNLTATVVSANQSLFTNLTNYVNSKSDVSWNTSYLLKTSSTDFLFLNGSRAMVGNLSMNGLAVSNIKNITDPSDATNLTFVRAVNQSLFTNLTSTIVSANQSLFTNLTNYVNTKAESGWNTSYLLKTSSTDFLFLNGSRAMVGNLSMNGLAVSNIKNITEPSDATNLTFVRAVNQSLFTNLSTTISSANQSLFTNLTNYVNSKTDSGWNTSYLLKTSSTDFLFLNGSRAMVGNLSVNGLTVSNIKNITEPSDATNLTFVRAVNQSLFTNLSATIVLANQSLFTNLSGAIASANQSLFTNLSTTIASANQSLFTNLTSYINAKSDDSWNTSYLLRSGTLPMTGILNTSGYNITGIKVVANATDVTNLSFVQAMNQSLFTNLSTTIASANQSLFTNLTATIVSANQSLFTNMTNYVNTKSDVSWNTSYLLRSGTLPMTGILNTSGYNITGIKVVANATDATNLSFVQAMNQSLFTNLSTTIASANQSLFTNLTATIVSSNQSLFTNMTNYVNSKVDSSWNTSYLLRSGTLPMTGILNMSGYNITNIKVVANATDATNLSFVQAMNQSLFTNLTAQINAVNISNMNNMSQYVIAVNNSMRNNVSQYVIAVNNSMRNNVTAYVTSANQSLFTNLTATIVSANQSLFTNMTNYVNSRTDSGWNTSYLLLSGARAMTGNLSMSGYNVTNIKTIVNASDAVNKSYVDSGFVSLTNTSFINLTPNTQWTSWTPALTWTNGTPSSINTTARYVKIGKTVMFTIDISSNDSNGCTNLTVTLPIAPANTGALIPVKAMEGGV